MLFNRKQPDPETKTEAWMQAARRAIQSGVPCWFTFKVIIWSLGEGQVAVKIVFISSEKVFQTSFKKDPKKFVAKEVIPWIRQNGQHV